MVEDDTSELQKLMGIQGFSSTKLMEEEDKVDLLGSIRKEREEERKDEHSKPLWLRKKGTNVPPSRKNFCNPMLSNGHALEKKENVPDFILFFIKIK